MLNKIKEKIWNSKWNILAIWLASVVLAHTADVSAKTAQVTAPKENVVDTSARLVWNNEVNRFINKFSVNDDLDFFLKIIDIQDKYWLKKTWTLTRETLAVIKEKYYWEKPKKVELKPEIKKTEKPVKVEEVSQKTKTQKISEIKTPEPKAETLEINYINSSENFVWKIEVSNFIKVFWIKTEEEFSKRVKQIQAENNLKQDWIIWEKTLRYIYLNYYSRLTNLPLEITKRLEFHREMSRYYLDKSQWYKISWLKWAFSRDYFYWKTVWENIPWTYLNDNLLAKLSVSWIEKSSYNNWNSIQVYKMSNWKYYLAMYVNWNLEVLTYVSPGTASNRTPEQKAYTVKWLDKYHISSSYPKPNWWAVMPYAYNIDWWAIWWHVWLVSWWGESHGCIRAPGFYQQRIYELLKNNSDKKFLVNIWDLY